MKAEARKLLDRVRSFSPYFAHLLDQRPSWARECFDQGGYLLPSTRGYLRTRLEGHLGQARDFGEFCRGLRRFKQEEFLRLAARDLAGISPVVRTMRELSDLARVCLGAAVNFTDRIERERPGGAAIGSWARRMVVLGMGKLGGEELNFSSDIDLIFLYQVDPGHPLPPLEQKQAYLKMARRIIHALAGQIDGDHVFRVDVNLRPGGKDSELVLSVESAVDYYQTSARTWERLALIKARPVAGNLGLGNWFLEQIQPAVFRKFMDYTVLSDIRLLKEKILKESRSHPWPREDLKLGPGGIREIEFITQALQLVFGGRIPTIRERNTLKALARLRDAGLLPAPEYLGLKRAYMFLRMLEHRVQMVHQQQTHALPQEEQALANIATGLSLKGGGSVEKLRSELQRARVEVRRCFDLLLLGPAGPKAEGVNRLLTGIRTGEKEKAEILELGFQNPAVIQEILTQWRKRLETAKPRQKVFLEKVYPMLFSLALQTADPDQALIQADAFLKAVGGRTSILAMLEEKAALSREIMNLFAQSRMMGRLFVQNPEIIEHLVVHLNPTLQSGREKPSDFGTGIRTEEDLQEKLAEVRRKKSERFLGTALDELNGRISASEASKRLTDLAEWVLTETFRLAEERLIQEGLHPEDGNLSGQFPVSPLGVVGLGKLGGKELGYLSDLDLIFVYDPKPADRTGAGKGNQGSAYAEYLVRLSQRLISYLSTPLREGSGYPVDMRLRPSGNVGPLIVSLPAFAAYYRHQAWNWEKQALLKARVIVGPPGLAAQIQGVLESVLYSRPPSPEVRQEMGHYRWRMERERSGEAGQKINPKLGYGGMADIEFVAQYLQWVHGQHCPEVRQSNTLLALQALKDHGFLAQEPFTVLYTGAKFLGLLEHGLQLFLDRKAEPRVYDPEELRKMAQYNLMGLGRSEVPSWDIVTHYLTLRENIRRVFLEIFAGPSKA